MRINTAIILAAGKSSRFGENKLTRKIKGKTLVERAMDFCITNRIKNVNITISKDAVFIDEGRKLKHHIVEQEDFYRHFLNIKYAFQNENEYGTGAAIKVWQSQVSEPFIVLAGDNLYIGQLPEFNFDAYDCYATYLSRMADPRNLQLAAVVNDIIIEKPHQIVTGNFFCGYSVFAPHLLDSIGNIEKSGRGEYEITDLINFAPRRKFIVNELTWGDITYQSDIAKIASLIEE